ncbi:hypothetical protein Bbelb_337860 [Branchiostoma belcheri]|nr:hypothetical protein Bbelb_337860 [Branchiostoma belcheri]
MPAHQRYGQTKVLVKTEQPTSIRVSLHEVLREKIAEGRMTLVHYKATFITRAITANTAPSSGIPDSVMFSTWDAPGSLFPNGLVQKESGQAINMLSPSAVTDVWLLLSSPRLSAACLTFAYLPVVSGAIIPRYRDGGNYSYSSSSRNRAMPTSRAIWTAEE